MPTRQTLKQWFSSPEAFGSCLCALTTDLFGTEWFEWHPQTVRMELDDLGLSPHPSALDRLFAAQLIVYTDTFFQDVPTFIECCVALNGGDIDPEVFEPAHSDDIAWGVTEALVLHPPEDGAGDPFSQDICTYIGAVLDEEGFVDPPDILRMACGRKISVSSLSEFASDPDAYAGIWQAQQQRSDELEVDLKRRFHTWLGQISILPLRNGSSAAFAEKLLGQLQPR